MLIRSIALLAFISTAYAETPAIYVVGDSTASNTNRCGWGDPFADYFDPAKVQVVNRARAGRSSRTFITEGLWDKVLAELKQGDFVLIQFGHNDAGPLDTGRARGSLPALGEETREITKPDGSKETVHTYGYYMRKLIADTRAKGATPIVLSLTVRNIWKDARVERGSGRFGAWSSEIALAQKVAFIDVTNIIADRYEKMGEEKVKPLFPADHTHTSQEGADLNASMVVAGLKLFPEIPFKEWYSEKGKAVARAAYPMQEPADPKLPSLYLIGDSTVRNGRGDGAGGQWGWGEPLRDLFDTSKIKQLPNFTRRGNPLQFDGLNGPRFWNVDSTLAKEFKIIPERLRFELRGEAYNLTNRFPSNDPDQGVTSRTFGKIISQRSGVYGRQIQFQGKFIF